MTKTILAYAAVLLAGAAPVAQLDWEPEHGFPANVIEALLCVLGARLHRV